MKTCTKPTATDHDARVRTQGIVFVVAGIVTTGVHAGIFLALRDALDPIAANLTATILTTIANTEFNRRVTFGGDSRSASRWLISVGLTVTYYATYSTASLFLLHVFVDHPTAAQQTATIVTAAILGGIARFLLLRGWVFTRTPVQPSTQD